MTANIEMIGKTQPVSAQNQGTVEALATTENISSKNPEPVEEVSKTELPSPQKQSTVETIGKTEPVMPQRQGTVEMIGKTEPVLPKKQGTVEVIGKTEPVVPQRQGSIEAIGKTEPVFPQHRDTIQAIGKTEPICRKDSLYMEKNLQKNPTGWLVCIEGEAKGKDFKVYEGYNYIGRGADMDVCLDKDISVAENNAAVIGYDSMVKKFILALCGEHTIVRHNGAMIMGQVALTAYDVITVGNSKLLFVPLCGEKFSW